MNAPTVRLNYRDHYKLKGVSDMDNLDGHHEFNRYHGKSWLHALGNRDAVHWETIFASHTFHEIQMYYPMRVVRDSNYKLIWNIAHQLPYPFASDLWAAFELAGSDEEGTGCRVWEKDSEAIHFP